MQTADRFGCDPEFAARARPLLEFLYRRYFRVDLQGVSHLPRQGPALLVANHAGALPYDSLMVTTGVQLEHAGHRIVRPLIEDELWHLPFLGVALRRLGAVRANPENAERLIAGGQLVAVFPEGTPGRIKRFRDRYRLLRFGRGGFVKLAL
ncbi:MAG: 1-acyl-sn-glycerol-3-phosphate acyltransferase, partial [Deltaproteobacteria bacterium]|nr:1-acyl-sn-glycerol-3-phosphate acyltransferase [Deltaproteobacteria bacterium]